MDAFGETHCLGLGWEISQVPESLSCPKKSMMASKAIWDTFLFPLLGLPETLSWVPLLPFQNRWVFPISPPEAGLEASFLV